MIYRVWARLPRWMRRRLVRLGAPTFSAGVIAVIEDGDRLLLVRLSYRRRWGMPGGLLARGEHPVATVVRETAEEVGIAVQPVGAPTVVVEPIVRRIDIVQRCNVAPGSDPTAAEPCSGEIVEARWFPFDDLPVLHDEAAGALRALGYRVNQSPR